MIAWMRDALQAELGTDVSEPVLLAGGASKEAWAVDAGGEKLLVRRAAVGVIHKHTLSLEHEYAVIEAAYAAGVKAPRPIRYIPDLDGREAFVMERLRQDFERGKRSNDSYAVLVFHLDQLGFVASHGGEADAEAALRHVANSLRKHMDTSDWLGRWDGGEFVGVLWGADEAAARDTCCRLQDSLADDGLMREGRSYSLSLSSGVLFPGRDETFPQLVERIRACLVTVRERGRNSLTVM